MESRANNRSLFSNAQTGPATVLVLLNTLSLFAIVVSSAVLAIALVTTTDTEYLNDFLYGRGSEYALALMFLVVSALISNFYFGALTLEPVMLPAWEQLSNVARVVWMLLLRVLWTLVCYIGPLGSAFLIGLRHPHSTPEEASGSRAIIATAVSPRFIHRWLAGTSPFILYH